MSKKLHILTTKNGSQATYMSHQKNIKAKI